MSVRINLESPTANMYGLEPCPQCKSVYREPRKGAPPFVRCDDCGLEERDDWQFCSTCRHPHYVKGCGPACPTCDCGDNEVSS